MSTSPEINELRVSLDRVRTMLEGLITRGLRACGSDELAQLRSFADDLERSGAGHVAGALAALHAQMESPNRATVKTLLMAQTSVRLLERLLTLRVVKSHYDLALQMAESSASPADDANDADADEEEEA